MPFSGSDYPCFPAALVVLYFSDALATPYFPSAMVAAQFIRLLPGPFKLTKSLSWLFQIQQVLAISSGVNNSANINRTSSSGEPGGPGSPSNPSSTSSNITSSYSYLNPSLLPRIVILLFLCV